jgi:serine/threonine protein kinase
MDVRSAKTDIEKMLLSNEIKALSTVSHNNVINCYEICHTVNNIYIIMEFCEQGNLSEFIKTHGKGLLM